MTGKEEAERRIREARETGAKKLDLSTTASRSALTGASARCSRTWAAVPSYAPTRRTASSKSASSAGPGSRAGGSSTRFDENLEALASTANLRSIVFDVIAHTESRGSTDDLLAAAVAERPRNPKLRAFADRLRGSGSETQAAPRTETKEHKAKRGAKKSKPTAR